MSLKPGAYRITNRKAPQLALSLSDDNQRSVIAEGNRLGPDILQTWIVQDAGEGKVKIMSAANRLFLGFPGFFPIPGTRLIVGNDDIAKVWEVVEDEPDYKFKPPNTPFVIQFPQGSLQPGVPAQLAPILPQADNQVWTVRKPFPGVSDDEDEDEDED
ncbi:hypothetical protein V8E53_009887 [Lactarius tabidus]